MSPEDKNNAVNVTQTDKDLILLDHTFCQEKWCASRLSDAESVRDEFIPWLREKYASAPNRIDEWETCSYEIDEVPALREIFADALGLRVEAIETAAPRVTGVEISAGRVTAHLIDGRMISAPLIWYPRLAHATQEERNGWELRDGGQRIHWPELDEEISVEGLLTGRSVGENQRSFRVWLEAIKAVKGMEMFEDRLAREKKAETGIGSEL